VRPNEKAITQHKKMQLNTKMSIFPVLLIDIARLKRKINGKGAERHWTLE
jgi:hypothetical protein